MGEKLLLVSRRRAATLRTLAVSGAFTIRAAIAIEAMARRAVLRATVRQAFRPGRTKFIHRQFAVAIFVELLERFGRVSDFHFVNHAVVVRIKRGDERRRRTVPFALRAAFPAWRTFAIARLRFVLCKSYRWQHESQRHDEC